MRNMKNPFQYGGVVKAEAFCNRQGELRDLGRAMENGEKLFVFSERRYGKTSLVLAALDKLPQRKFVTAYVDLWPTDGETTFVTAVAKAITQSMSTNVEKMLATAKELFSNLTPSLTVDESGAPTMTFGLNRTAKTEPLLDEVLAVPARIAKKGERRVVVVLDEVQQILEYRTDLVERKLRSVIQKQGDVGYLFLGSRKHLIEKMVLDRNRPLYRAGGHYPLHSIAEEHWRPFIKKRFSDANKVVDKQIVHDLCEMTQGHPFYTQHLCHALWELCEPGASVDDDMLKAAVKLLLDRENYAYTTLWESLKMSQKRFLKGLAVESNDAKVFSGEFVSRNRLGSPSNAQRAVEALLARDIIDREKESFLITDRFFRLWIQTVQIQ